jgi:Cu(I)/Ag(I) efflux system membrane fusion protein
MELVPKRSDAAGANPKLDQAVQTVKLSPEQQVQGNVETVMPQRRKLALTLPAIGEVQAPQDTMRTLTAWQGGRVDHLVLRESGGTIKQGERIMDVYSPELVQAEGEYLIALKAADELGHVDYESAAKGSRQMLDAARQKLTRLGMTAQQIAELEKTRKPQEDVAVYAQYGGTVLAKKVQEGMYVMPGTELFDVADLRQVWVEVQVFEKDAANLKPGLRVNLTSPAYPQRTFHGRVLLIEPELDAQTKTFKARVGVDNAGGLLKPGQVLDATVTVDYGTPLLLPRNAVLHTGEGDLVYVTAGDGLWEPRRVQVGRDFGDEVEIVSGLKPDEGVAGTAVFLLDSEAQLKGVPRPTEGAAEDHH